MSYIKYFKEFKTKKDIQREEQKKMKEIYDSMLCYPNLSLYQVRNVYKKGLLGFKRVSTHGTIYDEERKDVILTENYKIPYGNEGRDPMNTIIISSVGTGKTRGFLKSNLLQKGGSMVISDVKGDLYNEFAGYLQESKYGGDNYQIKLVDLRYPEKSNHYNPLKYIHGPEDVLDFASNLAANVSKGSQDSFWYEASKNLIASMIFYVFETKERDNWNLKNVIAIFHELVKTPSEHSGTNLYADCVELLNEDSFALRYYKLCECRESEKTWDCICATVGLAISKLELPQIVALTETDDVNLECLGYDNVALFINLDDTNNCYDFIAGVLYSQIFKVLYREASKTKDDKLPNHVRFYMDDFTNYVVPDIVHYIQTCRSKSISIEMLLQSEKQLYEIYKDGKDALIGNCVYVYIGSNDLETQNNIATRLGTSVKYVQNNSNKTFVFFPNAPSIIDYKADYEKHPYKAKLDRSLEDEIIIDLGIPEGHKKEYKKTDFWSDTWQKEIESRIKKDSIINKLGYRTYYQMPLKKDLFDSDEERLFWNTLINNEEYQKLGVECEVHRDLRDIFDINNMSEGQIDSIIGDDFDELDIEARAARKWTNMKYTLMLMHCDFVFRKNNRIISVLEIDGEQHNNPREKANDAIKNKVFKKANINMIRKSAKQIRENSDKVGEDVLMELKEIVERYDNIDKKNKEKRWQRLFNINEVNDEDDSGSFDGDNKDE